MLSDRFAPSMSGYTSSWWTRLRETEPLGVEAHGGGEIAAGAVAAHGDPCRIAADLVRVVEAPLVHGDGVVERLRERVLRSQPVVDVDDDAVGRRRERGAQRLELVGAEQHEPAAVEVDEHRQRLLRPPRLVDDARDVTVRSRDRPLGDRRHLDRRRTQRPMPATRTGPDLLERRRFVRLGLGRHGVEHGLYLWIDFGHGRTPLAGSVGLCFSRRDRGPSRRR